MERTGIRCSFMRGGTSKGMFFRWDDLPDDTAARDAFLCAAIGSPDPNGRQLDGMGGGISSLSKAMLVRRSTRAGVDIDYLFGQIAVGRAEVDYASNCGNLSSAVGAFAVDQGFVQLPDGPGTVRMFNENTSKRVDCHLSVRDGRAAVSGDQAIAGVAGQGSAIRLDFLDAGGARTGDLLPLEEVRSTMAMDLGSGVAEFSFVDAANPCVFVDAAGFGLSGAELPSEIEANSAVMSWLETIRREAGCLGGIADDPVEVPDSAPKVALIGPPARFQTLSGEVIDAGAVDVLVRMISMGKPHLAIPLTGAMATAVAARIPGTVVSDCARPVADGQPLRIGTASGVVPGFAEVDFSGSKPRAMRASVYRTARTLMEGVVYAETTR